MLLDALANAGTRPAQQVLVSLVTDVARDQAFRRQAAMSLIRVKQPDAVLVETLRSLIDDPVLAEHAVLGLGTASRNLRDAGNIASANEVVDLLVDRLREAKDKSRQTRLLLGIANSADPRALSVVEPLLSGSDAYLRRVAIDAISLMPGAHIDELLATRMMQDGDLTVRAAAVRVAADRAPSAPVTAALIAMSAEANQPALSYKAVEAMARWLPTEPLLRAPLEKVVQDATSAQTRQLAQHALNGVRQ